MTAAARMMQATETSAAAKRQCKHDIECSSSKVKAAAAATTAVEATVMATAEKRQQQSGSNINVKGTAETRECK